MAPPNPTQDDYWDHMPSSQVEGFLTQPLEESSTVVPDDGFVRSSSSRTLVDESVRLSAKGLVKSGESSIAFPKLPEEPLDDDLPVLLDNPPTVLGKRRTSDADEHEQDTVGSDAKRKKSTGSTSPLKQTDLSAFVKARKTSKHVDEHATAAEERAVKRPKRSSAKKTVEEPTTPTPGPSKRKSSSAKKSAEKSPVKASSPSKRKSASTDDTEDPTPGPSKRYSSSTKETAEDPEIPTPGPSKRKSLSPDKTETGSATPEPSKRQSSSTTTTKKSADELAAPTPGPSKRKSLSNTGERSPTKSMRASPAKAERDRKASSSSGVLVASAELPPYRIVDDRDTVRMVNNHRQDLAHGTIWEIARVLQPLQRGSADATPRTLSEEKLKELHGTNCESAAKVLGVVKGASSSSKPKTAPQTQEQGAPNVWQALDWETNATEEQRLGITDGTKLEYGGQVHFRLRIHEHPNERDDTKRYSYEVLPVEKGSSNRARRMYGSWAIVQAIMPSKFMNDPLEQFLLRALIILGSVYRAFRQKDGHVYFIRTNETPGDRENFPSFMDFIKTINPMDENLFQALSKWAARVDLMLSPSVPVPVPVEESRIEHQDDICSDVMKGKPGKLPAEHDMTDGSGLVNVALLRVIATLLNHNVMPSCIQDRFGGCKGTHVRHPDPVVNEEPEPRIWNRPSQVKIQYPAGPVPAHRRILDILRCSSMTIGCKISAEIIVNLAENGVPIDVFKALVKQAHDEEIELWTGFDRPDYAIRLRSHIMRSSNIVQSRMARSCEGSARAFGLRRFDRPSEPLRAGALIEDDENADENENDDDDDGIRAKVGQSDPFSGQPCSIGEVVIEALDAGFRPHNTPTLYSLMQLLAKLSIQQWAQAPKFSLSVPLSCSGLFVPDNTGTLKPNEVFIWPTGEDVWTGDVLIFRYPTKVGTDVQKVQATDYAALHHLRDVIILSTRGDRSMANFCSGGDMDGDIGTAINDPAIVEPFKPADPSYADAPPAVDTSFDKGITVQEFLDKHDESQPDVLIPDMQRALLGQGYDPRLVATYTKMHQLVQYQVGYHSQEARRLGHMCGVVLDTQKSGKRLHPGVLNDDKKRYTNRYRQPECFEKTEDAQKNAESNLLHPKRGSKLPRFCLDELHDAAKLEISKACATVQEAFKKIRAPVALDPDLAGPWNEQKALAEAKAAQVKGQDEAEGEEEDTDEESLSAEAVKLRLFATRKLREMALIRRHVSGVRTIHEQRIGQAQKENGGQPFKKLKSARRQEILCDVSRLFTVDAFLHNLPAYTRVSKDADITEIEEFTRGELARLLASCAYIEDLTKPLEPNNKKSRYAGTRMPWNVAFSTLCDIKASAQPQSKHVVRDLYDVASVPRKILAKLSTIAQAEAAPGASS